MDKLYNVAQFILGHLFFYMYYYTPILLPQFIKQQFYRRLHHRSCADQCKFECAGCGCKAPEVFFAPKACKNGSYPKLMFNKTQWDYLKDLIHKEEISNISKCKEEFKQINPTLQEDEIKYVVNRNFFGDKYYLLPEIKEVVEFDFRSMENSSINYGYTSTVFMDDEWFEKWLKKNVDKSES